MFGHLDNQKWSLMEELKSSEEKIVVAPLSNEDSYRKTFVSLELDMVLLMEEIS